MTRVAVLGLGEAGARLASDLASVGAEVSGFDPALGNGAPDARSAAAGCDLVLSVNSAVAARDVAVSVLPVLDSTTVYADLNTSAPALKREIASIVEPSGARFVDVALLGPVPARGLRTPVLASGEGAEAFAELLGPLGMPVEVVSGEPGDAARRKLLRSVFMKGVAAAAIESVAAADAAGDADWLYGELAEVIGAPLLDRFLEGSRAHAARRVEEMTAAAELLHELGIRPHIAAASAAVLADLEGGDHP